MPGIHLRRLTLPTGGFARRPFELFRRSILTTTDIKTGLGGLRDVEFLAQGLQLVHAHEQAGALRAERFPRSAPSRKPGILSRKRPNGSHRIISFCEGWSTSSRSTRIGRRTISPATRRSFRALARLMLGGGATAEQLLTRLSRRLESVQQEYRRSMGDAEGAGGAEGAHDAEAAGGPLS